MIQILPIDFLGQGALLEPADAKLHDKVVDYCARELVNGRDLNLAKFNKVWVALDGEEVSGISGFVWRIDIPVFRTTGPNVDRVTRRLIDRVRSFLQDQGARGSEVFLHISSKELPEQRCAKWEQSLAYAGAVPADRYSVKV